MERVQSEVESAAPTRVQPSRTRATTERFVFYVHGANDPMVASLTLRNELRSLAKDVRARCSALKQFRMDYA